MMKTTNLFSEANFREREKEIKKTYENLKNIIVPLGKDDILTESQVCELLGVTSRTIRKYRQKHIIGSVKVEGRILYLKHLLFCDLEALYFKDKEKE